jgi:hypothetical protein
MRLKVITPSNSFAPSLTIGDGSLTVTIGSGTSYIQGSSVIFGGTNVVCSPNVTTFIYLDLGNRTIANNNTGFPSGCYPIATAVTLSSRIATLTDNRPDAIYNGLEFLGTVTTTGNTGTVTFQPRDYICGSVRVTGYAAPDIASLQFNGDTGNNYVSRAVTMATGGITWANSIDLNTTNMIRLAPSAVTVNRTIDFCFVNTANKTKIVIINTATTTGCVGTGAPVDIARGEWFNSTNQVTSITLTDPSASNFGASIIVFGKNYS